MRAVRSRWPSMLLGVGRGSRWLPGGRGESTEPAPDRRPDAPDRRARRCTASSSARVTNSPAVWAIDESPGPKLAAGMPSSAKRATSVQPSLASTPRWLRATRVAHQRVAGRRRGAGGHVDHLERVAVVEVGRATTTSRRGPRPRPAVRSGAKRWLMVISARSGTTLGATPPSMATTCRASRNWQPVDQGLALVAGRDRVDHRGGPVDGVAPHPGTGGVGPLAGEDHPHAHRALAAGLDLGRGGLAEQGDVADQQVGTQADQLEQAALGGRRSPRGRRRRRSGRRPARPPCGPARP